MLHNALIIAGTFLVAMSLPKLVFGVATKSGFRLTPIVTHAVGTSLIVAGVLQ